MSNIDTTSSAAVATLNENHKRINDDDRITFEDIEYKKVKSNDTATYTEIESLLNSMNTERISHEKVDTKFEEFRTHLLRHVNLRLPGKQSPIYSYLKDTKRDISRILKQSIVQKESHSVIMVGDRNSFKTYLVDHELNLLRSDYHDQFITVKLDGFVHNEKDAINGIANQLEIQLKKIHDESSNQKSNGVSKVGKQSTDTNNNNIDNDANINSGSLTEIFEKILRLLDSASRTHNDNTTTKITVIFIFNEIDTFAGPIRQTLLYNLFDMVEHARVPVCIFGNTTKLNILELLEKRVKSRFSQRIINIPKIKDLDEFKLNVGEQLIPIECARLFPEYGVKWSELINEQLNNEDSNLFQQLKNNFDTFKSLKTFKNAFLPLIYNSHSYQQLHDNLVTMKPYLAYFNNQLTTDFSFIIKSLSDLEIAILICAARTALKTKDNNVNFNLMYVEYENMIKTMKSRIPTSGSNFNIMNKIENAIKLWSKADVKNVWESLQDLSIIVEKSDVGLRESAIAVFYASNYELQNQNVPFDLRVYHTQVTLQELRRILPKSLIFYTWTQL